MDEMKMKLSTKFMRGVAAKIISKVIYDKFGFKTNIKLNEVDFNMTNGNIRFHINVDGEMEDKALLRVIRLANLEEETE